MRKIIEKNLPLLSLKKVAKFLILLENFLLLMTYIKDIYITTILKKIRLG